MIKSVESRFYWILHNNLQNTVKLHNFALKNKLNVFLLLKEAFEFTNRQKQEAKHFKKTGFLALVSYGLVGFKHPC